MRGVAKERHHVYEASGGDLDVPLFHSEVELFEEHGVFANIIVLVCLVVTARHARQNTFHEVCYAHMDKSANFVDHDFARDFVFDLIELKLSLFFLHA